MIYVTPAMVKQKFDERFAEFNETERRKFRQRFIVHDYETYLNAVCLATLDIATGEYWVHWGPKDIQDHLRRIFLHNDTTVLVGFNNKHFDNRITDAILAGATVEQIRTLADSLIANEESPRWKSGDKGRYRPKWVKRTFDIGFDIGQKKIGPLGNQRKIPEVSLKKWERLNDLKVCRSEIPFDQPLRSKTDYDKTGAYCLDDVCNTAWLLLSDESWNPCLNARRVLVEDYGHKGVDWVMTKPFITSIVLNASPENFRPSPHWEDEFFKLPSCLRLWRHRDVLKAYTTQTIGELRMKSCKDGGGGVLLKDVCGLPHVFGAGGAHGCIKGVWESNRGGIYGVDAASLYPNEMRHYDLLSRCVVGEDRDMFGKLIDLRVNVYKPAGDKRADGLKLVLNGGFGSMGFEKSDMYDPVHFTSVTILGQLLMTDLLGKLERHINLIQTNTDGLFFTLKDDSPIGLAICTSIVQAFEKRTLLEMEWTEFENMYQRDISSYVCREVPKKGKPAGSGKTKKKGAWFNVKHCTAQPYLTMARVHAAFNKGQMLPTTDIPLDRFAIECKRDKNSECFLVDGEKDYRGWLDVVPVLPSNLKRKKIVTLCKSDFVSLIPIFSETMDSTAGRKRRKATNCPKSAALLEDVTIDDIDQLWFADKVGIAGVETNPTPMFDF